MKLETYQLKAANGRLIRKATKIVMNNGEEIRMTERITKREAMKFVADRAERRER